MDHRQLSAVVFAGVLTIAGIAAVAGALGVTPSLPADSDESNMDAELLPSTGNLSLVAADNQTIRGETSLKSGTTLTVRVLSESPEHPFIVSSEATVRADGRFRTTLDLSVATPGDEVRILVMNEDREVINTTAIVQATANETEDDTTETGRNGTELQYQGDAVTLRNTSGQTITGETNLTTGTQVTIRLRSTGQNPLLLQSTTTVGNEGAFRATFNLSDVEPGTELQIRIVHNDEQLLSVPGKVVTAEDS